MATRRPEDGREHYENLREALMTGRFGPNERLIEADISDEFGMPRAEVRTAFVRLEMEGLVQREPHRGTKVRLVSDGEALEILVVRTVLEGLAARLAAERIEPADAQRLEAAAARHREFVERGDILASAGANADLHALIREIARQPTATRLIELLNSQTTRFQYRTALIAGRPRASAAEHDAIVAAIVAGEPDEAERAMRTHLSNVGAALRQSPRQGERRVHAGAGE